jgi:adenylyltransferase/sulfurtransferase
MQANEVIKYLTGTGRLLENQLLIFDAGSLQSHSISLPPVTRYGKDIIASLPIVDESEVSVVELQRLLAADTCELIDVRSEPEHQDYNIGGRLVPLDQIKAGHWQMTSQLPVVFYCHSGARSATAVHLARQQFPDKQFFSLAGGVLAWQQSQVTAGMV